MTTAQLDCIVPSLSSGPLPASLRPSRDDASTPEVAVRQGKLLGRSPGMVALRHHIARVAPTRAAVLLTGETGTGKEVVARAIHDGSDRGTKAFVAINCGAIPASLVESELFGHEQGSFTGANRKHCGAFEQADKGTLFLDEIAEMPLDQQVSLLRVLEDGQFHRVGGTQQVLTDVRIVAATNRDAYAAISDGRLREDLFYRLCEFPLSLPPLRERGEDIQLLATYFLDLLNRRYGTAKRFTPATLQRLQAQAWPGNVRELKHRVHQLFILGDATDIDVDAAALAPAQVALDDADHIHVRIGSSIKTAEMQLIEVTMARYRGNKVTVAKILGISLKTLYSRLHDAARSQPLPPRMAGSLHSLR